MVNGEKIQSHVRTLTLIGQCLMSNSSEIFLYATHARTHAPNHPPTHPHTHTHTHTEGPTLSPNPTPPSPVRPPAGAPLQSRADARVGDESQGIAVKGLRCPLGYPRSNLGHLGMIAHRNGTMPRWPAPGTVRPGARAPSCGSLGSPPPEAGVPYPKKVRGGRRARRPSGTAL